MYTRLRMGETNAHPNKLQKMNSSVQGKITDKPDKTDVNHLFQAIQLGKVHLAKFIIEASDGKLQNSRDSDGKTPLIFTCMVKEERTRDQLVRLLLEKNANVNLTDQTGRAALSYACERRCNDIVDLLIHVPNIDPDTIDTYGNTPLIYCAREGNDVAIDMLIKCFRRLGLKVDHTNNEGFTALLEAARNSHLTCAKILASQGKALKSIRDKKFGRTPLEWFLAQGYERNDLTFLQSNSKFYRAVKLTSILKSKSFGPTLPHHTVHKVRLSHTDAGQAKRKLRQRSKSLAVKPTSLEHTRGKSKYRKQKSVDSTTNVDNLSSPSAPITVTTVISTVAAFANMAIGATDHQLLDVINNRTDVFAENRSNHSETAEELPEQKNASENVEKENFPTESTLKDSENQERDERFLYIEKLDG